MLRTELLVDPATCQPQILDDQQLVELPRLRAELALQLILASAVPVNRAFLLGSKHVIQLVKDSENEGFFDLFSAGNLALVMERNAPSLLAWWEKETSREQDASRRGLRGLTTDRTYVEHVSDQLEKCDVKTIQFDFNHASKRYCELLRSAVHNEAFLQRCFDGNGQQGWYSELQKTIDLYKDEPHRIGRDDLYARLRIPVTAESPEHNYDARQAGMKRVLDACYTANLPLHQGFSYSVTNGQVPLFFFGPQPVHHEQKSEKKRWDLKVPKFIPGFPDLTKISFGTLAQELNRVANLRSEYLNKIKSLKQRNITETSLDEFFEISYEYLSSLFARLGGGASGSRLHLSAESSGGVEVYCTDVWPDNTAEPIRSTLCFATGAAGDYSHKAQTFEDFGNRGS
jgi:hypothetical protein